MVTKSKKLTPESATNTPNPGDLPLGSLQSRAVARALAQAKEKDKWRILCKSYSWEPGHPPELQNSYVGADGKLWEVWKVPEGLTGVLP